MLPHPGPGLKRGRLIELRYRISLPHKRGEAMKPKPWLPLIALFLLALPALAAKDQVTGTFTVQGKTTVLRHVYATFVTDPGDPETKYVVLLLSDEPIAEADRRSSRIAELARQGRLHAVKIRWRVGYDDLAAVPYHRARGETAQK